MTEILYSMDLICYLMLFFCVSVTLMVTVVVFIFGSLYGILRGLGHKESLTPKKIFDIILR